MLKDHHKNRKTCMTVNLRISLVFVRMWDSAAQKLLPWKCLSTCTDLCHQKVIFLSNIKVYFAPRHHHLWYIPTLTTTLPHVCPCTLWVLAPDKGDRASSQSQCRTFGGLPMDPPFLSRNKTKEKKRCSSLLCTFCMFDKIQSWWWLFHTF